MPSLEWNKQHWDGEYDWKTLGNIWSAGYGNVESQWFACLYPRIHNFIPTGTILELAPGAGRWTQFLVSNCERFIAVDYSDECIDICKHRFGEVSHAKFYVNDGKSLDAVPDSSVDFLFSFDSLVHAEADVMESYVKEIRKKLRPDGVGFIHHSNLKSYNWLLPVEFFQNKRLLWRIAPIASRKGWALNMHSRARSMSARLFQEYCASVGLQCIGQELFSWFNPGFAGRVLTDCVSIFTPTQSKWGRPNRMIENLHFESEANSIAMQAKLYSSESFTDQKTS